MTDASKDMYLADDWISAPIADRAMRLAAAEALRRHSDWTEVVAGLDSLAVQFDPERTDPATARLLFQRHLGGVESGSEATAKTVIIPVCYDEDFGPDLNHVADKLKIHADDIPAWHAAQRWTVDMLGFQPGFAYCRADGDVPDITRLDQPRQTVPAGSVGLLGGLCGLYPFEGPGGWPLIGRTPLQLFDPLREPASLLAAGTPIRFEAIGRARFEELKA
ncbi:MAG: carboxyltransferase domain-containing protein [Novosphingopyxis baekryungensis]|nr:carboxyltransferase domain-containing protein [Novosphingopyxis baekryungensis]